MLGQYRISIWRGKVPDVKVATDATYVVRTRKGDQKFEIDQTQKQGEWHDLGVFADPWDVLLTNRANGSIVVDAVRFTRVD